jgi:thioredoxin reductase (NADPH)
MTMPRKRNPSRHDPETTTPQYLGEGSQEPAVFALSQEMIIRLIPYGKVEAFDSDTTLFERGARNADVFIVLEGRLELFEDKP